METKDENTSLTIESAAELYGGGWENNRVRFKYTKLNNHGVTLINKWRNECFVNTIRLEDAFGEDGFYFDLNTNYHRSRSLLESN